MSDLPPEFKQLPHGVIYQVNDTSIFVRNRPYSLECHVEEKEEIDKADAYLSVTDSFVVPPVGKPFVWFPWNEGRHPIPEMYYATNRVLNWWVLYQKLKRIQIFCDGGSHRSVTVFGAFLRTYFTDRQAREILSKAVQVNPYPDSEVDLRVECDPLVYIDEYLEEFPADRLLFKAMQRDRLGRLDGHSKGIYRLVKARYGDKPSKDDL